MSILRPEDLFPFSDYEANVKQAEANFAAFAQKTVAWIGRIQAAYEQAHKEIAPLSAGLDKLTGNQDGAQQKAAQIIQQLNQIGQRMAAAKKSQQDLTDAQQLNGQVITDLTARLATLYQRYQALDPNQKDFAKQQKQIAAEVKVVTRAIDAQSKSLQVSTDSFQAAEGSYKHLQQQTAALRKELLAEANAFDLATGKINEHNKKAVEMQKIILRNEQVLRNASTALRPQTPKLPESLSSTGNVAGLAAGMAGKAVGAGLAVAGIDSALGAIQKVGEITLQFDSLDSALKVVSNNTALFTERQAMLKRVSEDLGQDLSVVEKGYTGITASAIGTRLEGEKIDKIFEQTVGTMGRLKKSSADTDGVLLAMSQMIGKGTVSMDELKNQMAERVPGAMNIAARAMGVTTSKLTDMISQGKVATEDFLPKFAAELERTFNPTNQRRVEGLGANLARLRNEGVEWVKTLNIGDKAGEFIGFITRMGRSIREQFQPAVETSTARLADQTETLKQLEGQLPGLLSKYDELKAKAKLSTDEQRELQTVVNSLVTLVPSAATGFDAYGNALDVNKSKVLSFTAAQRELNAELNKQAISDLRKVTEGGMQLASQTQAKLNRGTKQESFNFKPFALMTLEERKRATDKNAGKRREVPLTDDDRGGLVGNLQDLNKKIELSIAQRLQLGDKLTDADKKYIDESKNVNLQRYKVAEEYNTKIAELDKKQAELFMKGDERSRKQREGVLKEKKVYEYKLRELTNPTITNNAPAAKDGPTESELSKAQRLRDKKLNDALSVSKATQDKNLTKLNSDFHDGHIDEQDFIEKQLQTTLAGINKRQALLEKANKQETKDYQEVLEEKAKAFDTYNRAQLAKDLKTNKGLTDKSLGKLDQQKSDTDMDEGTYIEKRHQLIVAGIERDKTTLKESGQEKSALYQAANQALLDEQTDYLKRRAKAEKTAFQKELSDMKDALRAVNETAAIELEAQLQTLATTYQKKEQDIQLKVKKGQLTPTQGDAQIHSTRLEYLTEQQKAFEASYAKDRNLSNALIDEKIEGLKNLRDFSFATETEIAQYNEQIRELEKIRNHEEAEDKKKLNKDLSKNTTDTSDQNFEHESKNIDKLKEKRQALLGMSLQLAGTLGEATFSILSGDNERQSQALEKQYQNESKLAGDNADAKAKIDQDYARQKAELSRKQAIADKEAALFQIAINTASGVLAVLSTGGGTHFADLGISAGILSAFVIATGIAQAAAVASKPLPEFYKGTSYAPEGLALVGERGPELRQKRDGSYQYYDKPSVDYLNAGDKIYTASQTTALIEGWQKRQALARLRSEMELADQTTERLQLGRMNEQAVAYQIALSQSPQLSEEVLERAFGRALDKRPSYETHIDKEGFKEMMRTENGRTEYRERRYRTGNK